MFIQQALMISKDRKTDDELKAIMATHAYDGIMYGFYKSSEQEWEPDLSDLWSHNPPDAIWVDAGITGPGHGGHKWLDKSFDMPMPDYWLRPPRTDPFDAHQQRKRDLEEQWWNTTVALVLHQIPSGYHICRVYYGDIEDETDDDLEAAWRDAILAHFDYSPEVKAAIGSANT